MTILELLALEPGTKGITVEGRLELVFPPKDSQWGKTQFMVISDGTNRVAIQTKGTAFVESDKGKTLKVTGGSWRTYDSAGVKKFILDVGKSKTAGAVLTGVSTVIQQHKEQPQPIDTEELKAKIFDDYKGSMITAMELLGDEVISGMLAVCKEKGWESKDVTAVAASLYIELNKIMHMSSWR